MPPDLDKPAYTVDEVAALTGFSRRTVLRMFEGERGVIVLARPLCESQAALSQCPHTTRRL